MKMVALGGGAALIGCALYLAPGLGAPHDVYPGAPAAIYDALDSFTPASDADGPLGAHPIARHGDHQAAIDWTSGAITCTAVLTPVDPAQTRVAVRCKAERAADPALVVRARIGMVEAIDAHLRGRPYNAQAVAVAVGAAATLGRLGPAPADRGPAQPAAPASPPSTPVAGDPAPPPPPPTSPPLVMRPVG